MSEDVRGINDLDPFAAECADVIEEVVQTSIRRLLTKRGTNPDDEDFGESVEDWISRASTDVGAMQAEFESEIAKDPRVVGVSSVVTIEQNDQAGMAIRLDLVIEIDGEAAARRSVVIDETGAVVEVAT